MMHGAFGPLRGLALAGAMRLARRGLGVCRLRRLYPVASARRGFWRGEFVWRPRRRPFGIQRTWTVQA